MQLTYLPHGQPKTSSEEEGRFKIRHFFHLLFEKACCQTQAGQNTEVIVNYGALWFSDTRKEGPSLLLVLKWGGELTPAGRVQAEELGRAFRCMYPGGQGETHSLPTAKTSYSISFLQVLQKTLHCHRPFHDHIGINFVMETGVMEK